MHAAEELVTPPRVRPRVLHPDRRAPLLAFRVQGLGFGGVGFAGLGRILCQFRIPDSKLIQRQSLTFKHFESEKIMRKAQRFSLKSDLRPLLS